jgi:spoIIIJ-associated protein
MSGESIEVQGRTTDEAIRIALQQLGVTRDEVEIEILVEGRLGVFGVGSQEARVRVTVLSDEDYEEEEEYSGQPGVVAADEHSEEARDTLERMLDLLDFPNVVTVRGTQEDRGRTTIHLDVAGDDVGLLIGRRGETLSSLQFLLNACLGKHLPRDTRVIVDVEHYRDRREDALRSIALRAADQAVRERRAITLQPMPPNERRIIHLTLQSHRYVSTESTGEAEERRVVISPKGPTPPPRRPGYGYSRGFRG